MNNAIKNSKKKNVESLVSFSYENKIQLPFSTRVLKKRTQLQLPGSFVPLIRLL